MSLSLQLLLLLLGSNCKASHFMGTVMTYYPKNIDGSFEVVLRSKTSFYIWLEPTQWMCSSGNCGSEISLQENIIYTESSEDWFQKEYISTRLVPSNAPFKMSLIGSSWVNNVEGIGNWKAVTVVETRNRSDIYKANSSPQTTIVPLLRVPSNCQRDFNLLAFDPDGDDVRCRYGNTSLLECDPCSSPPVLTLSSSCTLSFNTTSSSDEGAYVVQMVMEDFPKQNITLTQSDGSQEVKTNNDAISKIPVQFVVSVDPAVPSCTEGLFLPKFLTPTPANGAQLYTLVNETIEIGINAEALNATITELLYSGPFNISQTTLTPGQYILTWTPSQNEAGESHPICFVVQATSSSTVKYTSDLRCVVVTVGNASTTPSRPPLASTTLSPTSPINYTTQVALAVRLRVSSSSPVSEDNITNDIIQQIKDELVRRGIPSDVMVRLGSSVTTTVISVG